MEVATPSPCPHSAQAAQRAASPPLTLPNSLCWFTLRCCASCCTALHVSVICAQRASIKAPPLEAVSVVSPAPLRSEKPISETTFTKQRVWRGPCKCAPSKHRRPSHPCRLRCICNRIPDTHDAARAYVPAVGCMVRHAVQQCWAPLAPPCRSPRLPAASIDHARSVKALRWVHRMLNVRSESAGRRSFGFASVVDAHTLSGMVLRVHHCPPQPQVYALSRMKEQLS